MMLYMAQSGRPKWLCNEISNPETVIKFSYFKFYQVLCNSGKAKPIKQKHINNSETQSQKKSVKLV